MGNVIQAVDAAMDHAMGLAELRLRMHGFFAGSRDEESLKLKGILNGFPKV